MKISLLTVCICLVLCEDVLIYENNTIEQSNMFLHIGVLNEGYKIVTLENVAIMKRPYDGKAIILYVARPGFKSGIFYPNSIGMYAGFLHYLYEPFHTNQRWVGDDVWYHASYCNNLYHQLDHVMFFDMADIDVFHPINEVIFDSYYGESDIYEMHNFIHTLISTKLSKTKFYYGKFMNRIFRKGNIFFKTLHVAIKFGYLDFYFYKPSLKNDFRESAYKLINYVNYNEGPKSIEICIIIRKNMKSTRNILNANEIYMMLNNLKNYGLNNVNIKVEIIYFDGESASNQIKKIMYKDIIISPHGAGLTNMIWIVRKGVTIIECYSIFRIDAFIKISATLGFRYISLGTNQVYDDLSVYYDFKNKDNVTYYIDVYPQIHMNVFSFHPCRYAVESKMSISLKQILVSVYNSIKYHLYLN